MQQGVDYGTHQPEATQSNNQQAQHQTAQDQVFGIADDGIELVHLILDGRIALGLDLDQRLFELFGTALVKSQLTLVISQGRDPLTCQPRAVGQQGAILSGERLAGKLPFTGHIEQAGRQHAVHRFLIEAVCLRQFGLDGGGGAFTLHLLQGIELTQETYVGLHAAVGRLPAGGEAAVPADGLIR